MLQMIRDSAQSQDQQPRNGTRFMQCRLPVASYEWLRLRAFVNRTSMNSIVLEAIAGLQRETPDLDTPLTLPMISGTSAGIKFNVRLEGATYEWLRTKAFTSRGSINQLLIAALDLYRQRVEAKP